MLVAMYDVDSKIPNLALMKLTRFHRERGDAVVRFDPDFPLEWRSFDKIYASKVLKSSTMVEAGNMEIGGTGHDLTKTLPAEVDRLPPDYSLYPHFKGNIGFTMRGCRQRCPFCVVPTKEGRAASVATIADLLVQPGDFLMLLDNDFFGNPEWAARLAEIRLMSLRVNFSQGINVRIITDEQARALASVQFVNSHGTKRQVTFAWDRVKDEARVLAGLERCKAAGIKPWMIQVFVLIGFDSTPDEDLHRITTLQAFGCDPFAMPFDKTNRYQKDFARWVNGRVCRTVPWSEYRREMRKAA